VVKCVVLYHIRFVYVCLSFCLKVASFVGVVACCGIQAMTSNLFRGVFHFPFPINSFLPLFTPSFPALFPSLRRFTLKSS